MDIEVQVMEALVAVMSRMLGQILVTPAIELSTLRAHSPSNLFGAILLYQFRLRSNIVHLVNRKWSLVCE